MSTHPLVAPVPRRLRGCPLQLPTAAGHLAIKTAKSSRQIKRQNPGADLLVTADWEGSLEGLIETKDVELPPLSGLEGFTVDVDDAAASDGETAADVKLVPKPEKTPDPVEKAEEPVETPEEAAKVPEVPELPPVEDAEEYNPLKRNIIILGVAAFALLAGMTLLVRNKK